MVREASRTNRWWMILGFFIIAGCNQKNSSKSNPLNLGQPKILSKPTHTDLPIPDVPRRLCIKHYSSTLSLDRIASDKEREDLRKICQSDLDFFMCMKNIDEVLRTHHFLASPLDVSQLAEAYMKKGPS